LRLDERVEGEGKREGGGRGGEREEGEREREPHAPVAQVRWRMRARRLFSYRLLKCCDSHSVVAS